MTFQGTPDTKQLTISCVMLKNAQMYFENLAVFTLQNFKSIFRHFSTLYIKSLVCWLCSKLSMKTLQQLHLTLFHFEVLYPPETKRKLNVHRTFRRRQGHFVNVLNVLCTFNLGSVFMGFIVNFKYIKHNNQCIKLLFFYE